MPDLIVFFKGCHAYCQVVQVISLIFLVSFLGAKIHFYKYLMISCKYLQMN
jgi:hypothetical protein